MKQVIVLGIVIVTMLLMAYINRYLQKWIRPRSSIQQLLLFLAVGLLLVLVLTFIMVFIITRLFPDELIK